MKGLSDDWVRVQIREGEKVSRIGTVRVHRRMWATYNRDRVYRKPETLSNHPFLDYNSVFSISLERRLR